MSARKLSRRDLVAAWDESAPSGIIETAIATISPGWGEDRRKARFTTSVRGRLMASSYKSADRGRRSLKTTTPGLGSANADELTDLPRLREISRDLIRNDALSCGAVKTMGVKVIGRGLRPQARPAGTTEEWAREAEELWALWSQDVKRRCDYTRRMNLNGIANMAFRSWLENGDCFVILRRVPSRPGWPFRLALQLIEADRVSNPDYQHDGAPPPQPGNQANQVWSGIETSPEGIPRAYWISDNHPGERYTTKGQRWRRVPARNRVTGEPIVLHLANFARIESVRGMPFLTPVLESLKVLGDYSESEAMAALVSSFFTVFVKSEHGQGLDDLLNASGTTETSDAGELELGSGLINDLSPGEDVTFANPNRPNTAYGDFVLAQVRVIGAALGIPIEILTKHFVSSYSAARGSLLEAWEFFMSKRESMVDLFYTPTWSALMTESIALGELSEPDGFWDGERQKFDALRADWTGPAPGLIDEGKAVKAAAARIELGISNRTIEAAKIGHDLEAVQRQAEREGPPISMEPQPPPDQPERTNSIDDDEEQEE